MDLYGEYLIEVIGSTLHTKFSCPGPIPCPNFHDF